MLPSRYSLGKTRKYQKTSDRIDDGDTQAHVPPICDSKSATLQTGPRGLGANPTLRLLLLIYMLRRSCLCAVTAQTIIISYLASRHKNT